MNQLAPMRAGECGASYEHVILDCADGFVRAGNAQPDIAGRCQKSGRRLYHQTNPLDRVGLAFEFTMRHPTRQKVLSSSTPDTWLRPPLSLQHRDIRRVGEGHLAPPRPREKGESTFFKWC